MKKIFSFLTAILFATSLLAADVTGTINFGSAQGSTAVNAKSVQGNDSQNNQWTITTVMSQTSFTQNASYSQIGSSSKPATSITFTTTLSESKTIKAFSAKFGGFSGTAGTITLKVGDTTVGTGSLNATNDVIVSKTGDDVAGTVLTVTVTGISKGVKAYYISYTYDDGGEPAPVLQSIAVSGTPTTTTYEEKNPFDVAGLVVTGTYDVGDPAAITTGITWKARTNSTSDDEVALADYTLTAGQTSLQVQATVSGISSEWFDVTDLTVTEHVVKAGTYGIELNNVLFGTSVNENISSAKQATINDLTLTIEGTGTTKPRTDAHYVRFYGSSSLTVAAPAGFTLSQIVITKNESDYSAPTASVGTWTANTKTWTGSASSVVLSFSAKSFIDSISVTYVAAVPEVTVNPTSWDFESVVASEAASKVFSVSGSNLEAGDLTLSAPAGYSVIPAKITLTAAGALAATNVTVSKNTETAGTYNGNLTILGCGLSSAVNVSLKMIVTAATVDVENVTLDKHAITLEEDSTQTLIATVLPVDATNKAVTWASTNTAVATVENGVVTAVAPGTAKISVTSDADETKTDTCVVTVTGADLILDFTSNTNWKFPTSKTVDEGSYTSGDYTVKVAGSTENGFYFVSDDNCLLVGKQDAYLILPVLADTAIARVVTLAESTGSGSVKFNVYQGETAVSTEVTSCKVNQAFVIYPKKKNVEHSIVITSAHNARFNKIKIWYGPQDKATALDNTDASVKAVKVLREGQIFILRGEKVYTVQGQLVK